MGSRVWGSGSRVSGLGFRGLRFRVRGLESRVQVWGLGFRSRRGLGLDGLRIYGLKGSPGAYRHRETRDLNKVQGLGLELYATASALKPETPKPKPLNHQQCGTRG